MSRSRLFLSLALVPMILSVSPAAAGPTVVPTAEGQVGTTLSPLADVFFTGFEVFPGSPAAPPNFLRSSSLPLPAGTDLFTQELHLSLVPAPVASIPGGVGAVFQNRPAAGSNPKGEMGAFAFATNGSMMNTMDLVVTTFDENGTSLTTVTFDDVGTFPDVTFNEPGVAVDNQGRVTVVYTEIPPMASPRIVAQRLDGLTGMPLGSLIPITENKASPEVALLDPAGNRLVIPSSDFGTIRGNILDVSSGTPVVLPDFQVNTTPSAFMAANPTVAADPRTGAFIVAWEDVSAVQGDPINVRARRFDALGNPIGNDFLVNTTTANAQAQPAAAMSPDGQSVIVWAGDSSTPADALDVFAQAYDAAGNPIGGEVRVNTSTVDFQDRPSVRFLPEPDAQGRPRFAVVWRDVEPDDTPRGTGTSYRCFSIDGAQQMAPIFEDGFESGDTSSWSTRQN